jgi:hypothetical protein
MGLTQRSAPLVGVHYLPPVYLMPRAMILLPDETLYHLEVLLTCPSRSALMLQVYQRKCLLRDPNLDHSHNENSNLFPELGMDQSRLFVLFYILKDISKPYHYFSPRNSNPSSDNKM